jgi:hypothetical protein
MTGILGRIFGSASVAAPPVSKGDQAYAEAMTISDELIERMREASRSTDAARGVMADIWAQHHNVPFMATMVETVQEMKSPLEQKPGDMPS